MTPIRFAEAEVNSASAGRGIPFPAPLAWIRRFNAATATKSFTPASSVQSQGMMRRLLPILLLFAVAFGGGGWAMGGGHQCCCGSESKDCQCGCPSVPDTPSPAPYNCSPCAPGGAAAMLPTSEGRDGQDETTTEPSSNDNDDGARSHFARLYAQFDCLSARPAPNGADPPLLNRNRKTATRLAMLATLRI